MRFLRVGAHEGGVGLCVHVCPLQLFPLSLVPNKRDAQNNQADKGVAISFHTHPLLSARLIRRASH